MTALAASGPRPDPVFSLHIDTARTWRGGQSQVLYTVLGLRALGHRAALVAHPDGELRRRTAEGLDVVPLAPRNEIDLAAAWRLSRVMRQLGPDIVHAHDPHAVAMAAMALSMAAPSPRPPLVAARRVEFRVAHHSFSRWKYGQVDCFIANCEAIADRLAADGIPRAKIAVVHEGVDVERIARLPAASVHAAFFLPAQAPVVGNVAALVPHKGQKHLVDAAALVLHEVPDARFVIVGEGELRQALERQIKELHLERHVFLAGFRADVLELTKGFDLFAMSSVSEGMCTALVDAMAASKASVATAAGGIPEVLVDGETGYLVPPRDHRTMAERVVRLLKDPALRARMGDAAFRRARERFTVERMVEGTAAVYERLLARRLPG
ncbi:MAG TPA: glycosyltransferase family 4 protein [Vicinamibacterales bacterium]|nr:glycosyltransferase family 4 protein [Vicinamibacterales bacterium]